MRDRDSIPARWSCRISGYLLRISPALAGLVYRRPEIPFLTAPALGLAALGSILWLASRWF
jgi:hypothetical protein